MAAVRRRLRGARRPGPRRLFLRGLLPALFLVVLAAQGAQAQLSITPVTWNVIGLDSNNPAVGPNKFPVGARVCNSGATALSNVSANFVWDSANAFVNLGVPATLTAATLNAGACVDFYFDVTVTRTAAAYNTARRYHITASATGVPSVSTPTPREIYVELLISQGRNSVNNIVGPTTVYVGQTYQYTINVSTATQGYEQLEAFLELSNVVFQVLSVQTTYSAPAGATNNKIYADACGWDNDPTHVAPSPIQTYRSCIGPVQYSGGKAGGNISTTYTVRIISAGTTTASTLIRDFSGSSYHYNSDYGTGISSISITSLPPPLTLAKTASVATTLTGSTVTYTLRVTNTGTSAYTLDRYVDTPPTSPGTPSYVAGSSTFNGAAYANPTASGGTLTWAGPFAVPAGQSRSLTYQMTMPSAPGSYANSAVARFAEFQVDTTPATTDNAPATSTVNVAAPPDVALVKSVTPSGTVLPGADLAYTIQFTNGGGWPATGFVITDQIPTGTDFQVGSPATVLGTTGLAVAVSYSSDGGTTYAHTPASGGGGAPAGYDRSVTHVRWSFTGSLSQTAPNNAGSVSFAVRIR